MSEVSRRKIPKWGFGMSPLSKTMSQRYENAVNHMFKVLDGNIAPDEIDTNLISELKGLFNRCLRKDQWDWFTVFTKFGEPKRKSMQQITGSLVEFRRSILQGDYFQIDKFRDRLLRANLRTYLLNYHAQTESKTVGSTGGWVYVLSTKQQPDIMKIGITHRSVSQRVKEINAATGVLIPYSARSVFRVKDASQAERDIFMLLREYRMREDREFFQLPFVEAVKIIESYIAEAQQEYMDRGTVKWFNSSKGYGFIMGEDGHDYFVHYSDVTSFGELQKLENGQIVEFEKNSRLRRICAVNVRVL